MKKSYNVSTGVENTAVENLLKTAHNVNVVPVLTADWNLNQYSNPTAENYPSDDLYGFDIENFPIESIYGPQRPTKGMAKAIVNQSVVASQYLSPNDTKFYLGSPDDKYKYWVSPYPTAANRQFPKFSDGNTTCRPRVNYATPVKTNKIVIKLETAWATPDAFSVRLRSSAAGNWNIIAENTAVDDKGQVILYYNGSTWTTTRPATLAEPVTCYGVMLFVDSMKAGYGKNNVITRYRRKGVYSNTNGANSSLSLIAIEPHYEVDFTDRFISVDEEFDIGEASQLTPIGTLTTNMGTVVLSNNDNLLNNENTSSPFYGLLGSDVEFKMSYIYKDGANQHRVDGFTMFSDIWSGQTKDQVSVSLEDSSKYLKKTNPNAAMYENVQATEIVWRLLDSIGFTNYNVDRNDEDVDNIIPVFWVDGTQSVWEVFDSLCKSTQMAIYFDSTNTLQVKTRSVAFDSTKNPVWTFRGEPSGSNLPDIIDLDRIAEYDANVIKVGYKTTKWKMGTSGGPAYSKVWEPEGTVVLRSTPLVSNMSTSTNFIYIDSQTAKEWPYAGIVNIDGEMIEYEGKQFVYFTGTNGATRNAVTVTSEEQRRRYGVKPAEQYRNKNHFSGALRIKERGIWNTDVSAHTTDVNGWSTSAELIRNGTATVRNNYAGMYHDKKNSIIKMASPQAFTSGYDTLFTTRLSQTSTPFERYGAKIKFARDTSRTHQRAGIACYVSGGRNNGYYVELRPTNLITASERSKRNEVTIYSKKNNEWHTVAAGVPVAVTPGVEYELDVVVKRNANNVTITAFLNGQRVANGTTNNTTTQTDSGKVAMYIRGKTSAEFEYFYALTHTYAEPLEDFGFYDLKYGGVRGNYFQREHMYRISTRTKRIPRKRWEVERFKHNQFLFDDFGPYVHEVRQFDFSFEPAPVQYATPFLTNNYMSTMVEFNSSAFGGRMVIANTSRENAVLAGEDSVSFAGSQQAINQQLSVLGRNLEIADEETVEYKNEASIRRNGEIEVEVESNWLQSKSAADALGRWISRHWGEGVEEEQIKVFGNALIELTDPVNISYAERSIPTSNKYIVTRITRNFAVDTGLQTDVTVRRIRT